MSVSAASLISCSTFQLGIPNCALFFQDKYARGDIYCCSSILNTLCFLVNFFLNQVNGSCSLNKNCIINNNLIIIEREKNSGASTDSKVFLMKRFSFPVLCHSALKAIKATSSSKHSNTLRFSWQHKCCCVFSLPCTEAAWAIKSTRQIEPNSTRIQKHRPLLLNKGQGKQGWAEMGLLNFQVPRGPGHKDGCWQLAGLMSVVNPVTGAVLTMLPF